MPSGFEEDLIRNAARKRLRDYPLFVFTLSMLPAALSVGLKLTPIERTAFLALLIVVTIIQRNVSRATPGAKITFYTLVSAAAWQFIVVPMGLQSQPWAFASGLLLIIALPLIFYMAYKSYMQFKKIEAERIWPTKLD